MVGRRNSVNKPVRRAASMPRAFMPDLLEDGDRSQCRRRLQHRQDLGLEKITERVGSTPRAG